MLIHRGATTTPRPGAAQRTITPRCPWKRSASCRWRNSRRQMLRSFFGRPGRRCSRTPEPRSRRGDSRTKIARSPGSRRHLKGRMQWDLVTIRVATRNRVCWQHGEVRSALTPASARSSLPQKRLCSRREGSTAPSRPRRAIASSNSWGMCRGSRCSRASALRGGTPGGIRSRENPALGDGEWEAVAGARHATVSTIRTLGKMHPPAARDPNRLLPTGTRKV